MINTAISTLETSNIVARLLLDIKAVNFRPDDPFQFTSGWMSPVYIDCRWIISFVEARRKIIKLGINCLEKKNKIRELKAIAGGETAGIPYASWIAEETSLPMLYVRKQAKGFGRDAQIEGNLVSGSKVLLVEDLATDGGSKVNFVNALRKSGAEINDIFVVFFYDIFPDSSALLNELGINLHYLCTWHDILRVAKKDQYFSTNITDVVEEYLADPVHWSKSHGGRS